MVRHVAARDRHPLDHLEGPLLEVASLRGAAIVLGRQLGGGLVGVAQPLDLGLERGGLLDLILQDRLNGLGLADHRRLEVGQRVVAVLGRELLAAAPCATRRATRVSISRTWCWTAVERSVAEQLGELVGHLVGVGLERLRHRAASSPRNSLEALVEALGDLAGLLGEVVLQLGELALDQVDLGAGRLAIEHAGADLDGVRDRLRGRRAALGAGLAPARPASDRRSAAG